MMKTQHVLAIVLALGALAGGCSTSVRGSPDDAGPDAAAEDATSADVAARVCRFPSGRTCPAGQACPADDGCNTCTCAADGSLGCTLVLCIRDAGVPPRCTSTTACGPGAECVFDPGCGVASGTCQAAVPCAEAVPYCGCDGQTYIACQPNRPFARPGACLTPAHTCRTSADCGDLWAQPCVYDVPGCGTMGRCADAPCPPSVGTFCGCDGVTFMAPGACADRPFVAAGACH